MRMWYTIHHIDGIHNHLADLGSRWGNRFAKDKAKAHKAAAATVGLRGGPGPLIRSRKSVQKKALRLPMPKTDTKVNKPDLDVAEFILPSAKALVDREVLAASQQEHAKERPANLTLDKAKPQLYDYGYPKAQGQGSEG